MKKRVFIRIMTALAGTVVWLTALAALAETFFRVPVSAQFGAILADQNALMVLLILLAAIVLALCGYACWMSVLPHREEKRSSYVMQRGENGTIGVSVRSIEGLVQTCVDQNEAILQADISVAERRDGIVILLNVQQEAGVNIPLSVGTLQKQIRQYVGDCTGVDVQEVRVLVESTNEPHRLTAPVPEQPEAPVTEQPAAAPAAEVPVETAESPVEAAEIPEVPAEAPAPVMQPATVVLPPMPEPVVEEDDRPLHQRLFGVEEAPAIVPAPPAMEAEIAAEAPMTEMPDEEVQEEQPAAEDELDPNAVMDVVAAVAGEDLVAAAEDEASSEETQADADGDIREDELTQDD